MTHCGQMMDEGEDEEEEEDEEEQKKKRKRSSEEGDGMEEEEEEEGQPPKKQIRPNPDVTDPTPFQLPDPPQQRPQQQPADRNGYTARCESRPTFFLVIYTFLPSMVNRLLNLSRRSESGEADRLFLIHRQRQYLFCPDDVERKKTLTQRLSHLLTSAAKLLHHHHDARGPQYLNAAAGDSVMTANAQRLHQVTSDAIMLTEQHLEMLKIPDAVEEHRQKRYLEEIRLIIYDAVFLDHRLQEVPLERQGTGRYDMKVRDAWELVKLVCVEMRQVLDYLEELNKWISTYTPPPPDVALAPAEQSVRGEALAVVDRLAKFCHEKLADQLEFLTSRSNMAASASERPLYPDRMQRLDSLEVTTGFVWRSNAKNLAEKCERLLEFFERNIRILEQ